MGNETYKIKLLEQLEVTKSRESIKYGNNI